MKLKFALAAATAMLAAPALMAANAQQVHVYVNGGYTMFDTDGPNPGAVTGRVGADFGRYFAVEGEGSIAVSKDNGLKIDEQGVYGVVKLPLAQRFDIFARAGESRVDASPGPADSGFAWGAGGDFWFSKHDAIRFDWTRHEVFGDVNAYNISYTRKF